MVRGMRGFGVVCEMGVCLARAVYWMRGCVNKRIGLGCSNPVGAGVMLNVCL